MDKLTLDKFIEGMIRLGKGVRESNPNVIIAPINGAVPLIDILNIVDPNFDNSQVEYMPASSKLEDVRGVIKTWTEHFLLENCPTDSPTYSIAVVDEVVSGNSSVRVYKSVKEGINAFARERERKLDIPYRTTKRQVKYKTFGAKDNKCPVKSKEYRGLLESGVAQLYDVGQIVTMDRPEYTPVQFRSELLEGKLRFYPEIEGINISREYLDLLENIAKVVGADPSTITSVNQNKIMGCPRYLISK